MRKRNVAITIRMNPDEYKLLKDKVTEAGLTQQSYIIGAIRGATISSSDEVALLKEISNTFADVDRQLRGLATNVNQMAHMANAYGDVPECDELSMTTDEINLYRRESAEVWQSIRSLISRQKVMEQ